MQIAKCGAMSVSVLLLAACGNTVGQAQIPPACATLAASKTKTQGTLIDESNPDTARFRRQSMLARPAGPFN